MKTDTIAEHHMHSERYDVPLATQAAIAACRARGGRVVAVGTTCVRTLESWAQSGQASGDTSVRDGGRHVVMLGASGEKRLCAGGGGASAQGGVHHR